MDSSGNVIGISSLKDFGIKVTVLDGKYAIEYDKTKPVQNDKKIDGIKDKAPEVVDLARIDIVKTALSNKNFRVNLSSLLSGWESAGGIEMKKKASRFAELLQVQKIAEARDLFVDMTKGNKTFKAVSDYLAKESDVIKLQAALFDLRGGMMMDVTQANKVQANGTEVVIAESITDTEKRFEGMMKNPNMKELLVSMGLDISDYATLIRA